MMKQTLKIGVTALLVAGLTMSGIALAQTSPAPTDTVNQQAVTRIAEKLQTLVDDGTITVDQAQAVAETLAEGFKPGGPKARRGAAIGAVAEFLGMDREEFHSALQEYDTLADLAAANGSSATELIDFMVGEAQDHIAQAVEDGKLTQAEADARLADVTDKITEMVNSDIPEPGQHDGRGRGRGGQRGPGGGQGGFGGQPPFDGAGASA